MSRVCLRDSHDIPISYVKFQAEPPVQHVCGFTDAWFQRDRFCLTLKKKRMNTSSKDEAFVRK